ncbi:phosphoenolpyruvate carboxylase 2 [Artemisia annua]|uniref:Phosphoenolpyruvate carboxylase 2 n=1 Tax=Artemisia annua TaxID=35608 RepID=A0A2U1PTJ5_ARTAN|nr:phosphoenolpyruvate carboxylase 2 [Artemisia annua]
MFCDPMYGIPTAYTSIPKVQDFNAGVVQDFHHDHSGGGLPWRHMGITVTIARMLKQEILEYHRADAVSSMVSNHLGRIMQLGTRERNRKGGPLEYDLDMGGNSPNVSALKRTYDRDILADKYPVAGSKTFNIDFPKVPLTHGPDNVKPPMKQIDENGYLCFEPVKDLYCLSFIQVYDKVQANIAKARDNPPTQNTEYRQSQSNEQNLVVMFNFLLRIQDCLAQLYAKDITLDDKQDEALHRENELRRTPPTPQDEMRAEMKQSGRVLLNSYDVGINERVPYNAPLIQFSSWMGGDSDGFKQPEETASQGKKNLKRNTSGSKKQNTQTEPVIIEGDIPAMRPQGVKGSNNKTRPVLASTNGSCASARQTKADEKKKKHAQSVHLMLPKKTTPLEKNLFTSDTPASQLEGKKGSQSKNPVTNTSTTRGTYLRHGKSSSMSAPAFGYAPRGANTDDDIHNNKTMTEDNEDGIWVNINDLEEPWYPLKEYKPKYTIPDDIIIEDSSTGDSKYTHRAENNEHDKALIHKHNMSHDDMWDNMVDIDGKLNGKDACDSYIDEETWEVDSDVYSIRSVSSTDDLA